MNEVSDTSTLNFVLLAAVMPAISCILCFLIPRKLMWLAAIASTLLMLTSIVAAGILYAKGWQTEITASVNWFQFANASINISLLADSLSLPMLTMVLIVSFLVHLYSVGFMADDAHAGRFFATIGFFTFSMLGLVLSGNLLVTFAFWELVGFSSYLLIGHWRDKASAGAAATKAFIINRIGDALFLAGLMIIWKNAGTFDIQKLMILPAEESQWLTWAGVCVFCGVIGKSAQFPLLTWLPDAMEGPTPVSALIHAATMVAAGVFLLLRIPFLLTPSTEVFIAIIGSITTLYASWIALQQYDLKRILAWSTISQLGLMMLAIGAGSEDGAFVHLLSHAFFKACLFLGAGAIIHRFYHAAKQGDFDPQDIRNMGGMIHESPGVSIAILIACAALCGVPLLSGFVSKEMIVVPMIHRALTTPNVLSWFYVGIFFVSSLLTILYTYRMCAAVFFGKRAWPHADLTPVPPVMKWPVHILAFLSLWIFFSWSPAGPGNWLSHFRSYSLYLSQWKVLFPYSTLITILSIVWTVFSGLIAWWLFTKKRAYAGITRYPLDNIYDAAIVTPTLRLSQGLSNFDKKGIDGAIHLFAYSQVGLAKVAGFFDRFIVDGVVTSITWIIRAIGNVLRKSVGTSIQSYLLWTAIALIIFLFWLLK